MTNFGGPTVTLNAADWYWIKKDGLTLFSSKRNQLVPTYDSLYLAWISIQQVSQASSWPTDVNNNQTTAALQTVMSFYLPSYVVNLQPP